MHRITTLDEHGTESVLVQTPDAGRASIAYCRIVLRQPQTHVRWTEGVVLPGLPEKVLAERFGAPCESPCCVPLAAPWPEETDDPAPSSGQPERERK